MREQESELTEKSGKGVGQAVNNREVSEKKVNKILSSLDKEPEKDPAESVPLFLHEAEMTRMEIANKRLLILSVIGWILTLGVIVYTILTRTN